MRLQFSLGVQPVVDWSNIVSLTCVVLGAVSHTQQSSPGLSLMIAEFQNDKSRNYEIS